MPDKKHPHALNVKGHPREGLHARFRAIRGLTPRAVLRAPLILPVVIGDEFTVEEEALWEEFDTVGAGRFAQAAAGDHAAALHTVSPEAMSMTWDPGFLVNPDVTMEHVKKELQRILRRRAIFDLLVLNKPKGEFAEFAGYATLRRLSISLKRGEADARYLSMDLSSHRQISAVERSHGSASNLPTTTTITDDTTLRNLADHYYGNGSEWRLIAAVNGISSWGSEDPLVKMGRYKVGDRIKIPEQPGKSGGTVAEKNGVLIAGAK
jgi:hypothetical protein